MSDPLSVYLDGLLVTLFRGGDGKLVVDITSDDMNEPGKDMHENGSPNIRININEQKIEILPDGSLKEGS